MPYWDNSSAFGSGPAAQGGLSAKMQHEPEVLTWGRVFLLLARKLAKQEALVLMAVSGILGFLLHMLLSSGMGSSKRRGKRWDPMLMLSVFVPWSLTDVKGIGASSSSCDARSGSSKSNSNSSGSSSADDGDPVKPRHIAVIMDGNRRYGREKHNDALQGHWVGGQTLVDFIKWCMEEGLEVATLYAFSTENWARDPLEVSALMTIFAKYAESLTSEALQRNVRVCVLSTDFERLPLSVRESVQTLVSSTQHCSGFTVNICLSYGGRAEILNACSAIANEARDSKRSELGGNGCSNSSSDSSRSSPLVVTEAQFSSKLGTHATGDPDLLIRTSGEYRLSNFLLWQLAYTELFFVDKYWPEMTRADLRDVLERFAERHRRYGS